jgi:hypothetical protein
VSVSCDGPYVCPYPEACDHKAGERWTCPGCGARYRLTRPKPERRWRPRWSAPYGYWKLTVRDRVAFGRRGAAG